MSTVRANNILDASGGNTATINGYTPTLSNMAGRNRIINGDMRIDQRNAGASTAVANNKYIVDRWKTWLGGTVGSAAGTIQQSTTAPTGFTNSLALTVSGVNASPAADFYSMLWQAVEGFNVADLGWGAANAQSVTLSFWVRSSVTGTFGGSIINSAQNRSYPFTYSISSANTFEYKTVTIAGDTSGTWLKDNGIGISVSFGTGSGTTYAGTAGAWAGAAYYSATGATNLYATNGATFYITGVQLEAGSVATPFERRDYGRELIMCQRYYQVGLEAIGANYNGTTGYAYWGSLMTPMRATPTMSLSSGTTLTCARAGLTQMTLSSVVLGTTDATVNGFTVSGTGSGSASVGVPSAVVTSTIQASAEL